MNSNFLQGEFIVCFKDKVDAEVAVYLIENEGLKIVPEFGKICPMEIYSNAYTIDCPNGQEKKFMKLIRKKLSEHIEWVERRDVLLERRIELVDKIKQELDILAEGSITERKIVNKLNQIKSLVDGLKMKNIFVNQ